MTPDERRAYSRGYQAGRAKQKADTDKTEAQRTRQAYWDQVYLTAVPWCLDVSGWKHGDKPISMLDDRIKLARDVADYALKYRRNVL